MWEYIQCTKCGKILSEGDTYENHKCTIKEKSCNLPEADSRNAMKRYKIVERSFGNGSLTMEVEEDPDGNYIEYSDYVSEKEKSNSGYPPLADVLAELEKISFIQGESNRLINFGNMEQVLRKYFSERISSVRR